MCWQDQQRWAAWPEPLQGTGTFPAEPVTAPGGSLEQLEDEMPAKVGYLVIDAADPERLALFWCGLLAVTVDTAIGDGEFLVLSPAEDGLTVGFQRVAEPKAGKNRLHLDLVVDDLDQATAEVEKLGGRCWSRGRHASLRASGGAAWPIQRATSLT